MRFPPPHSKMLNLYGVLVSQWCFYIIRHLQHHINVWCGEPSIQRGVTELGPYHSSLKPDPQYKGLQGAFDYLF